MARVDVGALFLPRLLFIVVVLISCDDSPSYSEAHAILKALTSVPFAMSAYTQLGMHGRTLAPEFFAGLHSGNMVFLCGVS